MVHRTYSTSVSSMILTYERYQLISQTYANIVKHYGKSVHHAWIPELILTHDPNYGAMGEFFEDGREIIINFANCSTMKDVISTLIHEYVHYLQPPFWSEYTGEDDDPTEIEANQIAKRDLGLFYANT